MLNRYPHEFRRAAPAHLHRPCVGPQSEAHHRGRIRRGSGRLHPRAGRQPDDAASGRPRIAYLFISHDMGVVERMSHRVAVMYAWAGSWSRARAATSSTSPTHPYTKRLLSAVPVADPSLRRPTLPARPTELPSPVRAAANPRRADITPRSRPGTWSSRAPSDPGTPHPYPKGRRAPSARPRTSTKGKGVPKMNGNQNLRRNALPSLSGPPWARRRRSPGG